MGESITRNMYSSLQGIKTVLIRILLDILLTLIHDERTHEHKKQFVYVYHLG
jgi:hypothetical protein